MSKVAPRAVAAITGLGVLALSAMLVGCSGKPSRIAAPTWDPAVMADRAIADLDQDADGKLSAAELASAPGLQYNAKQIDADGDGHLSRDEIFARIEHYQKMGVGLTPFTCTVLLNNRPLVGAKVRLAPEPFLGDIVEPREATSAEGGSVKFAAEGINMSVVPVCMYRVEITSPEVTLPARYNTETTLGIEVAAMTDIDHQGPPVFHLEQ